MEVGYGGGDDDDRKLHRFMDTSTSMASALVLVNIIVILFLWPEETLAYPHHTVNSLNGVFQRPMSRLFIATMWENLINPNP